jgi:dipicolinate synthase subunit A
MGRGTVLVCGLTDDAFRREALEKGWRTVPIYDDEKYQLENAEDSAEGAVYALMREAPFALNGKSALVIGYGRLGRALKSKLANMGVEVTVAARDPVKRMEAGESNVDIQEGMASIGQFDMVINTAPAQIIGKTALQSMQKDALLMDTASAPYGFNLEEAKAMRIHAWRENGIPGIYCPKTAAKRLMDLMERRCVL